MTREQRQGQDDRGRVWPWEDRERLDNVEGKTMNWPLEKDLEKGSRWLGGQRLIPTTRVPCQLPSPISTYQTLFLAAHPSGT